MGGSVREAELERWFAPILASLGRAEQRTWAPVYLRGLLGPGERKSIEPIAEWVAPGKSQSLHHFIAISPWDLERFEATLVQKSQMLVGGRRAVLIIDDTTFVKQGKHSVGVAHQYCGELGKNANCQSLISLTLARGEVPVPIALRLFLPEAWASDPKRRRRAGVPEEVVFGPKWQIALDELDRVRAQGAVFACVLADAGYGNSAGFRHGLSERGLLWAVGILPSQKVYPADVQLAPPVQPPTGRPQRHPTPSKKSRPARDVIGALLRDAWQRISWRCGTKGDLKADFAAVRVRVADGPLMSRALELRAGASATQERAGFGPLRAPKLDGATPPCAALPDRLLLPPAPEARGENQEDATEPSRTAAASVAAAGAPQPTRTAPHTGAGVPVLSASRASDAPMCDASADLMLVCRGGEPRRAR